MFQKSVCKDVPQECPTRVSRKSVPQECPARVSYKSVPQECPRKSVRQEFPTRVSHKSVLQDCPGLFHKSVRQACPTRVSYKGVPQECPTRVFRKSVVPQECPRVSPKRRRGDMLWISKGTRSCSGPSVQRLPPAISSLSCPPPRPIHVHHIDGITHPMWGAIFSPAIRPCYEMKKGTPKLFRTFRLQRLPATRVFPKSAPQKCPTRVCYKSAPQECPTRVSDKSGLREPLTRAMRKSVPQECPTRVSCKSVPQESSARAHRKSKCHTRVQE